MKRHKMEIAALTLLLGVLCYAFYDSNIKGNEKEIVLKDELLSMREIHSKEEITMEMLSLPLAKAEIEKNKEVIEEEITEVEESNVEEEETEIYVEPEPVVESYQNIPEYNGTLAEQIINYALQFVGGPYVYGGNSLTEGTDCSGFTKLVFANFDISLERSAPSQIYNGVSVGLENIMPGDIVLSGYDGSICHSSLYIGDGKLVHALNSNVGIVVTDLYIMPIISVRRVI